MSIIEKINSDYTEFLKSGKKKFVILIRNIRAKIINKQKIYKKKLKQVEFLECLEDERVELINEQSTTNIDLSEEIILLDSYIAEFIDDIELNKMILSYINKNNYKRQDLSKVVYLFNKEHNNKFDLERLRNISVDLL